MSTDQEDPVPDRTPTEQLDDLATVDRQGRVGRTTVQVGIPVAIVGIGSWLARLFDLDLDPGAGVDMPADVVGYWVGIVTVGLAWWMNRKRPPE
jgi:hypothetical protein